MRHKGTEDFRYQEWRRKWTEAGGQWGYYWRAFIYIFVVQAIFSIIVNSAALYIMTFSNSNTPTLFDLAGAGIWALGFGIEWIADEQLRQHL